MGREEIDVISPALEQARDADIDARGPYPADTLFQPRHLRDADCVLAMYHDQGLAPSSTAPLATASISRWGCPSSAHRWTMAPRSTWPALAAPSTAA
jgi:hypothetical protein